ncbi:hypothetical protein BDW02DRAFT_578789 [Decorospora gaudefroyi]|uniref:Secreted protein n=1 Tax=Decorospora gaudefroyi TaxID=184978 RepID=A0A6A5KIF9_9PLEO|nr:hypothetical protein BDW02DRAFT_578789 [Decorospora gaudefroyi]
MLSLVWLFLRPTLTTARWPTPGPAASPWIHHQERRADRSCPSNQAHVICTLAPSPSSLLRRRGPDPATSATKTALCGHPAIPTNTRCYSRPDPFLFDTTTWGSNRTELRLAGGHPHRHGPSAIVVAKHVKTPHHQTTSPVLADARHWTPDHTQGESIE